MDDERGRLARLLGDPVRVRRPASSVGLLVAVASGASYLLLGTGWPALLYGLTWLALPIVALLLGYGNAFFISHGRGGRRALLEVILGLLGALVSCLLLAGVERDSGAARHFGAAALAGLLYLAVLRGLAAGLALAIGRGLAYAGRRIMELDDEGW